MAHAEIKETPDVPEFIMQMDVSLVRIHQFMREVKKDTNEHALFNAYITYLLNWATCSCENQEQADQIVETICQGLKKNIANWATAGFVDGTNYKKKE